MENTNFHIVIKEKKVSYSGCHKQPQIQRLLLMYGILTNMESGVQSNYPMKGGWIIVGILLSHERISGYSAQRVGNHISLAKIHQGWCRDSCSLAKKDGTWNRHCLCQCWLLFPPQGMFAKGRLIPFLSTDPEVRIIIILTLLTLCSKSPSMGFLKHIFQTKEKSIFRWKGVKLAKKNCPRQYSPSATAIFAWSVYSMSTLKHLSSCANHQL